MPSGGGKLLAALILAAAAPSAGQGLRTRVVHYVFHVSVPDTGSMITGRADVCLARPIGGPRDTLSLDAVGLVVDSVTGDRGRLPFDNDSAHIRAALPADWSGSPACVRVSYHASPRDGLIIGSNSRGARVAFGDNWPERARYWLPVVDQPAAKATVAFSVDAPAGFRVVGPGGVFGPRMWRESHPIPPYTMVIGVAKFAVSHHRPVINGRDTIPMEVWTYPEDSAFADSVPFKHATTIVETLQRIIGPFPYEKLAHVESSTRFGGMENSSAIFYAEKPYVERRMEEGVVRHETAHQWFGDAVTERDWHHLWLSEGFASYFDLVAGAALHGDSVLTTGMRADAQSYMRSDVVDRPVIDTAQHDPLKLLNANNYQKGAWILHMLRGLVGDSAFFLGIREYYRRFRDSTALSEDFQQVMEEAAGRQLEWFFQQWLRQPGYPRLEVVWRYDSAAHQVRLDFSQAQSATWGSFRLPRVNVEIRSAGDAAVKRTVSVEGRRSLAIVDLPSSLTPAGVRIDPDGKLLLDVTVTRTDRKAGNH
jgi:aminopeptidase N